jgi:hypothetical protein
MHQESASWKNLNQAYDFWYPEQSEKSFNPNPRSLFKTIISKLSFQWRRRGYGAIGANIVA